MPISVNNLKNKTLLGEVEKRKYADFLSKMSNFHNIPIKTYPKKFLNEARELCEAKNSLFVQLKKSKENLKSRGDRC